MSNIVGIRLFRRDFGDIMDVVKTLHKISSRTIITEEMTPYQHYHILIYTDKSEQQVKKFIQNHRCKGVMRLRNRNNTNVQKIQNEPRYIKYITKNFVRGFDSCFGWLTCNYEYTDYQFDTDIPDRINNIDNITITKNRSP